eukprot:8449709-Karenia_brevis.AAC.1
MGLDNNTHMLIKLYSQPSTQATLLLANKGGSTLASITKRLGCGQRVIFKLQGAKAPDELDMYQHQ